MRALTSLALATSLVVVTGCGAGGAGDPASSKNVFGPDHRVDVASPAFPLTGVVRMGGCSGVFVGKNLVLTAGQCLVTFDGRLNPKGFHGGTDFAGGAPRLPLRAVHVWYGGANPGEDRSKDWAVLQLDAPAGDGRWLAVDGGAAAGAAMPYPVSLAGFMYGRSSGTVVVLDKSCSLRERRDAVKLFNDCGSTSGISGGPLLRDMDRDPAVVAIAVSEYRQGSSDSVFRPSYSSDFANVALSAEAFGPTVAKLKATVENGLPAPALPGVLQADAPAE